MGPVDTFYQTSQATYPWHLRAEALPLALLAAFAAQRSIQTTIDPGQFYEQRAAVHPRQISAGPDL